MRWVIVVALLVGCRPEAPPDQGAEVAELKKRVAELEAAQKVQERPWHCWNAEPDRAFCYPSRSGCEQRIQNEKVQRALHGDRDTGRCTTQPRAHCYRSSYLQRTACFPSRSGCEDFRASVEKTDTPLCDTFTPVEAFR